MATFKVSAPTQTQVINSAERVVAVFLIAVFGVWQLSNYSFSSSVGKAAILAGITAVYQLVLSTVSVL